VADRRRTGALLALLAAVALLATGCGGSSNRAAVSGLQGMDNHGYHGTYLDSPYVVPSVALPDANGKPYDLATATAPLKVVFFGYTKCPDICQVVMSTIASAVNRLDADQRSQVQVVFVTTDPARDTGPVLRDYLDHLDPAFVGLTGPLPRIVELATPLKVFIEKGKQLPSGGYDVTHGTQVYAVVGNRAQLAWNQDTSPSEMAADIIKLLKS
jgi:protein SCO1/2